MKLFFKANSSMIKERRKNSKKISRRFLLRLKKKIEF
jgi:hypothetical protein